MIVALRALGVGDLATGVPALRGLRAAYPDDELALAAPAWLTPLIDLIGGIDRVLPTDGLEPPSWTVRPDLAVNLHGCGPQSNRLLEATGAGRLWAFGAGGGPAWTDDEHEVARWCRLLDWYGVATDPADLSLASPPVAVPDGLTVLHPGAKSPSRRWPPERFAAAARHLAAIGHKVVVTGSAGERGIAARVAELAGLSPDDVLAGSTGLAELAGLVARARLLISGDTGIAHLASAYGTPSVVLFGPMPPSRWGPPAGRPQHHAIWHGTRAEPGDAPGPDVHPALRQITVDEVLTAADAVSGER